MTMKRVLSLIMAVLMLVSMVPVDAHALSHDHSEPEVSASATHSHPVCGQYCSCASDSHSNYTWQAWDGTTKMYNGNYYLTKDVVLDSTMILDYGELYY